MNVKDKTIDFLLNNDSLEEIKELKKAGYLITDSIYGNGENNYRLYGTPPFQDTEENGLSLTLGPFPVKKEHYNHLININKRLELEPEIGLAILLTPIKIQYEIYGECDPSRESKITENLLQKMVGFITNFYDLTNPIKTDNFFWIMPKEDLTKKLYLIDKSYKEKPPKNWWNISIQISKESIKKEYNIKKRNYFQVPYICNDWIEYLPARLSVPLVEIFSIGNKNGRFIRIKENKFKEKFFYYLNINKHTDTICTEPDKEILCKKLYEENNIKYPTNNEEIFNFFIELKFIKRKFIKGENYIYVNKNIKEPTKSLKLSNNWKQLNEQYHSSGSIILNYLSLEEYIRITTKKAKK